MHFLCIFHTPKTIDTNPLYPFRPVYMLCIYCAQSIESCDSDAYAGGKNNKIFHLYLQCTHTETRVAYREAHIAFFALFYRAIFCIKNSL
jgi:hypothetical protein